MVYSRPIQLAARGPNPAHLTFYLARKMLPVKKNIYKKKKIIKKLKYISMNQITPCITHAGRDFYHEALVPISVSSEGILSGF